MGALALPPPKKKSGKCFSGKNRVKFGQFVNFFSGIYHVKFGNFVNFSCIYFRAKMSCPLQSLLNSYAYEGDANGWWWFIIEILGFRRLRLS